MQEPLDKILKEIYQDEIDRVRIPPVTIQPAKRIPKLHRYTWLQAAAVFVVLCIFAVTILSAGDNHQSELAKLMTEVNQKYGIAQHIPEQMEKLQQIFCIAFKYCS